MEQLARWWTKRYNLPSNHELFVNSTLEELLVDFHIQYFEEHSLEQHRNEDGEIFFSDTGDELIDSWEERLAQGEDISLEEAFAEGELEKITRMIKKTKGLVPSAKEAKTFEETNRELLESLNKGQLNTFGS